MKLESGSFLGQYKIIEQIGRGGMATIYKAHQPSLDRYVAIKVLHNYDASDLSYLERFRSEAIVVARLEHPNILRVYDAGEHQGMIYIVIQLITGGTLTQRLGHPLPLDYTLSILKPVASALDCAHQQKVIHRDVKPSNILMTETGVPILSDFGIAKMLGGQNVTGVGMTVGTPKYMAPEQAMGGAVAASDIYSLGIILYEMATGSVPFTGDTPISVMMGHAREPLQSPRLLVPHLPVPVEMVIAKSLAKAPEERFQTAGEMALALADALQVSGITSASPEAYSEATVLSAAPTMDPKPEPVPPQPSPPWQTQTLAPPPLPSSPTGTQRVVSFDATVVSPSAQAGAGNASIERPGTPAVAPSQPFAGSGPPPATPQQGPSAGSGLRPYAGASGTPRTGAFQTLNRSQGSAESPLRGRTGGASTARTDISSAQPQAPAAKGGSAPVFLLVTLLLVGLVGAGGWFLWESINAPADAPAAQKSGTPRPAAAAQGPKDDAATSTFMVVGNTGGIGAYLRGTPNLDDKIRAYADNTAMQVTGPVLNENGTQWRKVRAPDGTEGYLPVELLVASPKK